MAYKKAAAIFILIFIGILAFSQSVISAGIDADQYNVDELIEVGINVNNNPGFHGIYFDISYDSSVLEFEDIFETSLIKNETQKNEMLYAISKKDDSHIIVSYTLKGNNTTTTGDGEYLKLWFKVKNQGGQGESYKFTFNDSGFIDVNGNEITGTIWQDSGTFTINSPYAGTFVLIKKPYDYEVFYKDIIDVSLICSKGDFYIKLVNEDNPSAGEITKDALNGVLLDEKVALNYGFNRITARLFDSNDNLLCKDTVKVYRSQEDRFVKIVDPPDHSLLNTDMIEVIVHSPYDNVKINGILADFNGETINNSNLCKVYKTRLWLKEGFNKITATVNVNENNEDFTYVDTIEVYYQKDSNIFNFVLPKSGDHIKPGDDSTLLIKGEIDSLYRTMDDPAMCCPVENTVTLKVTYKPYSTVEDDRILVNNEFALITESDYGYSNIRSKYVFYNDFPISLNGLDNGELEITAYKNKEGNAWDDKITRVVYIDNNRLWIDLVQPNVFTDDLLDTYQKIKNFNEGKDTGGDGNIEVSNDGGIRLKSTEKVVEDEGLKDVVDVIEDERGILYALSNDKNNGLMKLYEKNINDDSWRLVASKSGLYGYKLCKIDIGVLIGASSVFNTINSGLFIYKDNMLININFADESIPHVQFIENHKGRIYLYGNYYDYLYSFNTYAIEENLNNLTISTLTKTEFKNSLKIKSFILTSSGKTAVIKTNNDEIYFYKKENSIFTEVKLPALDGNDELSGKSIICGEYENGDYNTYLIVKENNNTEIIMENIESGRFYRFAVNFDSLLDENDITLLGAGFKKNSFVFLYKKNDNYYVKRGKVFFESFYPDDYSLIEEFIYNDDVAVNNYKIFIKNDGSLFSGLGDAPSQTSLFSFYNKYEDTGSIGFNYVNDDIDGLRGIEFEIDPIWLDVESAISFGFKVKEKSGESTSVTDNIIFQLDKVPVNDLLDPENSFGEGYFKVTGYYDVNIGREVINFEFDELHKDKYISFDITIGAVGNATPAVYGLKIFKKVKAKICKEEGDNIILPIHGYIYDRTVKEVNIQHETVKLERDGSFYHDLMINTQKSESIIEIYCVNGSGETARIEFTIEIVDSKNKVWDLIYKRNEDTEYSDLIPDINGDFVFNTTKNTISIQGKYYGLAGCVVGYEIYDIDDESVPARKGVFTLTKDDSVKEEDFGPGYEYGYFSKDDIELIPGSQKIIIYCENPGGLRVEYNADDKYPVFTYNILVEDQKIILYIDDLNPIENVNNVAVSSLLKLDAYETETIPYKFKREYEVSGYINALNNFDKLIITSFTNGLVFENNSNEITVDVETGNRFKIKFNIEMQDDDFIKDYYIGVCPINPAFDYLERGFKVTAKKYFKNTNYIPDFSAIDPGNWTAEQKESLNIPIKLSFNRSDIPTELTTNDTGYIEANLLINYNKEIKGILYEDGGYYYLKSNDDYPLKITGDMIKEGINRIQWSLTFRDFDDNPVEGTPYQMSYSNSGKTGMSDYIFEYHSDKVIEPTVIIFDPDLNDDYYDFNTLPEISITKDKSTILSFMIGKLNNYKTINTLPWDEEGKSVLLNYDNLKSYICEGKNEIIIKYSEQGKSEVVRSYIFMFDSSNPAVSIESYKFNDDYTQLLELTVSVDEANFAESFLYTGTDIVNKVPDIIIKGENKYQLIWNDLEIFNIQPSEIEPVKVIVNDLAGKTGTSGLLKGFENIDRPEESEIKEVEIVMPQYEGNPDIVNETNYTSRDFPGHTKFAPEKLIKRVSVKDFVADNDDSLIKGGRPQKADPIYWSRCESVDNLINNPDIKYNQPYITSASEMYSTNYPRYGSHSIIVYQAPNTGRNFLPLGSNYSGSSKYTISMWLDMNIGGGQGPTFFHIDLNASGTDRITFSHGGSAYWNHFITAGGVVQQDKDATNLHIGMFVYTHVYIVVDEEGGLSGGETIQVYFNGVKVMATTAPFNSDKLRITMSQGPGDDNAWWAIDNIKIWDYIVDDDPVWLLSNPNEYRMTDEDFYKPVYWSKCDSIDNITASPEIGSGNGSYNRVVIDGNGKFNNCVFWHTSGGANGIWYPQGANYTIPTKGTLSFWMNKINVFGTRVNYYFRFGAFYLDWYNEEGIVLMVNGQNHFSSFKMTTYNWHHIYIVWDKDKGLEGKSVKLYIDNTLILESEDDLTNWDQYAKFQYYWYDDDDNNSCQVKIDNVKLWDHVIADNPDWLNDLDQQISALQDDYGKYLIFKIAKDPFVNGINSKDDINGGITFEVVGKKWDNVQDEAVEVYADPPELIFDDEDDYKYIEGSNHVYYMVNAEKLKDKYLDQKGILNESGAGLDPNGEEIIIDPGSLRIKYNSEWTNFEPVDVYLAGEKDPESGQPVHAWKDMIVYDYGYESDETSDNYTYLNPGIRYPVYESDESTNDKSFVHNRLSDEITINFWLRLEDEGISESIYADKEKKVFTFSDSSMNDLFHLSYKKDELLFVDNINIPEIIINLETGKNIWNMVTICIDKENNLIGIYINAVLVKIIDSLAEETIQKILLEGARYYFGRSPVDEYNTGFFSVALPFYIDRLLTLNEIQRIYNLYDKDTGGDITNNFSSVTSVFGPSKSDLHKIGDNDFFTDHENADYTEDMTRGSFKASSIHRDFLKIKNMGVDNNCVILNDAGGFITNNLTVTGGINDFTLTPQANKTGRYYFGDKTGNYGLGKDRWYSISGEILDIADGSEARLVLRINGEEQDISLNKGHFHFIFNNNNNLTPSDVKLYIETKGSVKLSTGMSLNEGNYIVEETLYKTGAGTLFPYDLEGTVAFWYKPLNSNKDGFVNYEAVIYDSEYIKIGTRLQENDAVYYAEVKNSSGKKEISFDTNTKVKNNWQYIQLSYSTEKNVVYFYVDGSIAAKSEGVLLPVFGSLTGNVSEEDNVFIGCNIDKNIFAEGYIDNLLISAYYMDNKYADNKPCSVVYDGDYTVAMNLNEGIAEENAEVYYKLEAFDSDYFREGDSFPINLLNDKPGRYRLTTNITINGHRYKDILSFNIDNKPKFSLVEKTPIVFSSEIDNLTCDVGFKFNYDKSYQFKSEDMIYAGLTVKINYNNGTDSMIKYITQDHIDHDAEKWLVGSEDETGGITWESVTRDNYGNLNLVFSDIDTESDVVYEIKYFYITTSFTDNDKFENIPDTDVSDMIPVADIHYTINEYEVVVKDEYDTPHTMMYEYMLEVSVVDETDDITGIFDNVSIGYELWNADNIKVNQGEADVNYNGNVCFYYDDIMPDYGVYRCGISLKYEGTEYARVNNISLAWEEVEGAAESILEASKLEVEEFSLMYIDKETDTANLYLKYYVNNVAEVNSTIDVVKDGRVTATYDRKINNMSGENTEVYRDISIPKGACIIKVTLRTAGFMCTREFDVNNFVGAPEIVLTNWVDSLIPYNNVLFSWKGYYEGKFNENIEYTYNFDNSGWSTPNSEWRTVRFYDLDEGYHSFAVKAVFNGVESSIRSITFFVDVARPVFDENAIEIEKIYDEEGILYAVNIKGKEGAVSDVSLKQLFVSYGSDISNESVDFGEDGSFYIDNIILHKDGKNVITLTAVDKVGNFKDYDVIVENKVTEIVFPGVNNKVRFCPMVFVGKISKDINAKLDIYIRDPFCEDREEWDYSGWKKAKINADRTFFVEDIYINPGTKSQEILTTLKIKCVFKNGKEFERDYDVWANEIRMPIEINLSTHAAEGENTDTYVDINCKANVERISSWSIDYDGDGVYDDVELVLNPDSAESMLHKWSHKYSSLGLIKPRVRVITTDGNFFSVSDTLIIHEKINGASNKLTNKPISFDAVSMEDGSKRVFLLADNGEGADHNYDIEVYEIGRNEEYISRKLDPVNISSLNIESPVKVRVLDNDHIFVGSNINGSGVIYQLTANEFGNYEISKTISLNGRIKEITNDNYYLFVSFDNMTSFVKVPIADKQLDVDNMTEFTPDIPNSVQVDANTGIAKDPMGLLIADYYNQRIIRLTNGLKINNQWGSIGTGEGEFLKPAIIKSFENRIFIFDEARYDIQIFDQLFKPVCRLEYNTSQDYHNYLAPDFFNDIADMDIVAREENNRLYYYALILSRSTGKLAMLRLPQWEELRAKVRNNKIVFIQDGEMFTAKPDGGDLSKILSSDSIPKIEGTLDYPALSPDGKNLVFTSRVRLYNGEPQEGGEDNQYAYDNVYTVDIETKDVKKIDLGDINGYEIERPVFNSNGDKLIFSAKKTGSKWQIYVYDFEEKTTVKLFDSDENARFPYYSPDDRFVVFTTDYDGNEEIEIIDTQNTAMRVSLTNNNFRDSLPVWNTVYPGEILNDDLKIESKIAFVSERNHHKGIYHVYLSRKSDSDIRVVKKSGEDTGNNPDSAAIEITNEEVEGDYPCFTGDGRHLVFEYYNGEMEILKKYDFETGSMNDMQLPGSAMSPAGMKNMIANFKAVNKNGNEIGLTWNRYTENDIFYRVYFTTDKTLETFVDKKVFEQTGTALKGLEMGQEYLVKVCIIENEEEVATSQWKKVKMPEVVARPSFEIDENNPYLVRLKAWKPKEETEWNFAWIIDNNEINVGSATEYTYEFATSGVKLISLKASNKGNTATNYSSSMKVNIASDIEPVIEYTLTEDSASIVLSSLNSKGEKIDKAKTEWAITGTGNQQTIVRTGSFTNVDLSGFKHKIYVNLKLYRIPVNGQSATDIIEKNMAIDLDFKEVRPVITYEIDETNRRLFKFSGEQSLGNINWLGSRWAIFADNSEIYRIEGVSTVHYVFPETNKDTVYSVSLTVPRANDNTTETASQIISVEAAPIEAQIDYEIMTIEEGGVVIGKKVLFDCTKSIGSDIDFNNARWNVPIAVSYGEQPTQYGPTSFYTLLGAGEDLMIEVALTISRKGNSDPITVKKIINISGDEAGECKLVVSRNIEADTNGTVVILDVLKSSGGNIDWEKTEWLIDSQYTRKGSVARIDIPASGEKKKITYVCTLYRYGSNPQTESGMIELDAIKITPVISYRRLSDSQKNIYELSVLDTKGINIDWEKTQWYIYDGNENVVEKRGSKISHAFSLSSEKMGYPVMVEMYFKGSSYPFVNYTTIDVLADKLIPIIKYNEAEDDPNTLIFDASSSMGGNIDWNNTKWTFGDSSEYQYGPSATHTYRMDIEKKTYRVTLTLTRRSINGNVESEVVYRDITIGKDKIKPKIYAKLEGDTLFLSAADSEGRGLMLDRSVWMFAGIGDNYSYSSKIQGGVINRSSINQNDKLYMSGNLNTYFQAQAGTGDVSITASSGCVSVTSNLGGPNGCFVKGGIGLDFNTGTQHDLTASNTADVLDYSDYQDDTESFSQENYHTGVVCRRYIGSDKNVTVSLMVYRMDAEGGMQAETITVNIDLDDAKGGVVYE